MSMPLNQQIGRFLHRYSVSYGMYLGTLEANRAHARYERIRAVADLFYDYWDKERDDEQRAIDELTEEDYENHERGIHSLEYDFDLNSILED